jgi:hypothetical protein
MATFTLKGVTFESDLTDAEVHAALTKHIKAGTLKSNFAADLVRGYTKYRSWSERQAPWAHKILVDHEAREAKKGQPIPAIMGFATIMAHMVTCRERRNAGGKGLLNPVIHLPGVVLKLAGNRSKRANCISVAAGGFGSAFYGWINQEGGFEKRDNTPAEVVALLERVAADPGTVISQVGKECGRCCYCWAELSQVQSKIAGAGKKCSSNYDVWYPNAAETREFLSDDQSVLVGATDADRWV